MRDEAFGWAALALWMAGMAATAVGFYTWPRGPRCRCQGGRHLLRVFVSPSQWLVRGRCWYILTGLPHDGDGQVRCPECGVRSRPARALRDGRRFRWNRLGVICLALGSAFFAQPWISGGHWVKPIPTAVLAIIEDVPSQSARRQLRDETALRVYSGTVTGWSATVVADRLVRDLHQDGEKWNADRAAGLLGQLWPLSSEALEHAVASDDVQARVIAAGILRQKSMTPSQALLRACMEDLRDDSSHVDWYLSLGNALSAAEYLVRWASDAEPLLAEAMRSDDRQQRLLAAAVAGYAARLRLVDQAAPILIDHLRDNSIRGDAKVAAPALYRFGSSVLAHLQPHTESDDPQLRAAALSIVERLTYPDRSRHRMQHPMPRITQSVDDPLTQLSISASASDL